MKKSLKSQHSFSLWQSKFVLVILLFLIQLHISAQTSDTNEGCFPLSVQFTAPNGFSNFFWDFDNGATAITENPSNTFSSAGTYIVEFSEFAGGAIIGSVTIEVYEQPIPTFTADPISGCAPLLVNFSDNTTLNPGISITGYSWVFGDGGNSSGANTSHVFGGGSHSVSFGIITNIPSCNNTVLYDDYILVSNSINASFTTSPSPATSCTAPFTVSFNNTSTSDLPLDYSWDLGNGETSTATNPPTQTYTEEGVYNAILTATDPNGCSDTYSINIGVGSPEATFEVPDTVCLFEPTFINNTSPLSSVSWNFGSGVFPSTTSVFNPTVTYNTPGFHDITLNINGNCPTSSTQTIYVEDPSAEFTSNPSYSCYAPFDVSFTPENQNAQSYSWTFGNDDTSTETNPTVTYENEDTTTYSINGPHDDVFYFHTTLSIVTAAGCTDSFVLVDTLHEPNALIFPDVVDGCVPLTVNFSDSSITNIDEPIVEWEWFFGDGTSVTANNSDNQEHTYSQIGVFNAYLIITNSAGCTDTSFLNPIQVGDLMPLDFSVSPLEVCPGETVDFSDLTSGPLADSIDAWHFTTESGMMSHCFLEPNASWAYEFETGPQDVTLMVDFNGCLSSSTQVGLVNVLGPIAHINFDCTCDDPFTVNFEDQSGDATSVLWEFGDGETSTDLNPIHTYAASGDYEVVLTATNNSSGCQESVDTKTVHIRNIQANFTSDTLICQGEDFSFSAGLSEDVFTDCNRGYHWEFSDPSIHPWTTGSSSSPFNFPTTGYNDITLVVTDINGCTDTTSNTVKVFGIHSEFTFDPDTICLPMNVQFTDASYADTTLVSWSWDFDDQTTSNSVNPDHIFTSSHDVGLPDFEVDSITLVVTDVIGCSASLTSVVYVYDIVSELSVSDNTLCSGDVTSFSATDFTDFGSNLSFDWNFGNMETSTDQNPTDIPFDSEGNYTVLVNFVEIATGCSGMDSIVVNVFDFPVASFTSLADESLYICPDENVLFTNTTTTTSPVVDYFWDFGNDNTSDFENPGTTYSDNGTYTVQLTATVPSPYGCVDSTSNTYTVQGPQGGFVTDLGDGTICRLDSVLFTMDVESVVDTFYWDFGDGVLAPGVSPISHQYTFVPPSGQTTALLVMTNSDGSCPTTAEAPINIYEVIADFTRNFNDQDTALCFQPYPLQNLSQNANSYSWDFGDGTTSTSNQPNTHNYETPGTYEIMLAIENLEWGCTDTIFKEVVLHPIPDIAVLGDTICEGDVGNLTVTNPIPSAQYIWSSPTNIPILTASQPQATSVPLLTAQFDAYVLDTNGCDNQSSTSIVVINDLDIFDFDTIVPQGDFVYLPLEFNENLFELSWEPEVSQGEGCLTCSPPYVQAIEDETYLLNISDLFDCFTASAEYEVLVHPETFIAMPTTFTPNGDGVNDVIYVEGWGIKELLEFKIFNRYGELVFETNDPETGWDGYYKGKVQNNDAYAFKVKATNWKNEEQVLEGYINLMR